MKCNPKFAVALLIASCAVLASAQKITKVTLALPSVAGGVATTGTVEITSKAGATGAIVSLACSQASVTVPATVTIPKDQTTITFPVATIAVQANVTAVIKATINGSTDSTTLKVEAPEVAEFTFIPASVQGGSGSTGTIKLSSAAPIGGTKVHFSSTTTAWGGPDSIMIGAGGTVGSITFTTVPVGAKLDATVSAFATGAHVPAILTLTPPILTSFTLPSTKVVGGSTSTGTLTLNGVAPKEGVRIKLSTESNIAKVPETVTIPAGATIATFSVTTKSVTEPVAIRIVARAPASSIELSITVGLPTMESFTLAATTVIGGSPLNGTVTLTGAAPAGGVTITLSSQQSSVKVPTKITIPAGATTISFALTTSPVTSNESATITAGCDGSKTQTATVYVTTNPVAKKPPPQK